MIWPAGILAVAVALAARALLVRHLRWRGGAANVIAFGLWPAVVLAWALVFGKDQDGLEGGLIVMILFPIAVVVGAAAVAVTLIWDAVRHMSGMAGEDAEGDGRT
jgi:hypothetical protein